MEKLEGLLYELKPLLCLGMGVYALSAENPNMWLISFGSLLLFAALIILRLRMRNRRGTTVEAVIYEAQPYFYLAVGVVALYLGAATRMAVGFSLLLILCATLIIRWRWRYRK